MRGILKLKKWFRLKFVLDIIEMVFKNIFNKETDKTIMTNTAGPNNKMDIIKEFWDFLKTRKKWWLAPIVIIMLLMGLLIILTEGSAVAPFIYTLF